MLKDQGKVNFQGKENLLVYIGVRTLLGRGRVEKYNIWSVFSTVCVCVSNTWPLQCFLFFICITTNIFLSATTY